MRTKKCSCQNKKISGMARISKKSMGAKLVPIASGTAGFVTAGIVGNRLLNTVSSNPYIQGGAKVLLGLLLATRKGNFLPNFGYGMAVAGTVDVVNASGFLTAINGLPGARAIRGIRGARRSVAQRQPAVNKFKVA